MHPHDAANTVGAPWYVVWVLWIIVTAGIVVALSEWPKRWLFRPLRAWKTAKQTEKVLMLAPMLAVFGVLIGGPIFYAAELLESRLLCKALGAGVGVFSWALYDALIGTIAMIPRIVKRKLGAETTTVNAVAVPDVGSADGTGATREVPAIPSVPSDADAGEA